MTRNTQWAAQFGVASELCKLGYQVSYTLGNVPGVDLMAISPQTNVAFSISVKGLYKPNPWLIKRAGARPVPFYILAYVPTGKSNQFFIMTQEEVTQGIQNELLRLKRPDTYPVTGFVWKLALPHENAWSKLPQ